MVVSYFASSVAVNQCPNLSNCWIEGDDYLKRGGWNCEMDGKPFYPDCLIFSTSDLDANFDNREITNV